MKYFYFIFLLSTEILFSQNSDAGLYEILKKSLSSETKKTLYDTLTYKSNLLTYEVRQPRESKKFGIIDEYINKDFIQFDFEFYTNGEVKIDYDVKHLSLDFISILKTEYYYTEGMPSPSTIQSTINVIKFQDKLFQVELSEYDNKKLIEQLLFEDINKECTDEIKQSCCTVNLLFENGNIKIINPLQSKYCKFNLSLADSNLTYKFLKIQ